MLGAMAWERSWPGIWRKARRNAGECTVAPASCCGCWREAPRPASARRLRASFTELPVFGKTGTCSNLGTRYGWFASYSDSPQGSLVTVFFLEGGRPTFGPRAAELTGTFYRNLWDHNYFADKAQTAATLNPVSAPATAGQPGAVQDGHMAYAARPMPDYG